MSNPRSNDYSTLEAIVLPNTCVYSMTVSIVVPFYRGLSLLANTLAGILLQSYPRELMEVIISEDGDTGEATALVSELNKQITTRLVQHPRNGYTLCTTRNQGIRAALGEIIVLLDFDVVPLPNLVANHARWFHSAIDIATIGLRKFVDATNLSPSMILDNTHELCQLPDVPSASNRYQKYDNRVGQFSQFKLHPHPYNCFHGCNVAFLRHHAIEVGLFDEEFNGYCGYDDIEFGCRLWQRGNYLVYEPQALGLHQENEIVSFEQREASRKRNLDLLYSKVPSSFRSFRVSLGKEY